ncbi:M81 family metallopeptidase [Candidatus Poriferisodalis sp.]|uniref:M81 family metallopeptidase n=1 Tax=Candidatus Poriferisodalis sp. TaxID=3101277 RepID=UPI003B024762
MRVATLGFHHESNTFAPVPASLDQFLASGPDVGDGLIRKYAESQATLAGFIEAAAADADVELVPLVYFDLNPMGTITAEALEAISARLLSALDENGPWDAILLALHGAAASEVHRDADGEVLERVRRLVGAEVPIAVTYDMHANVSARMVDCATVVNTYMTNPHLDPRLRARECADLAFRVVRGEIHPVMALEKPPLAVNILRQGTTDSPMAELVAMAAQAATRPGVLSVSIAEGFPYADVEEMGMAFLAVTDGDADLAGEIARELARAAWEVRTELEGDGISIDEALRRAATADARPVVLLDVGDNVGAGSPGDSTHVLAAAQRLAVGGLFHSLCDPASVAACADAGVGATVELEVGGKTDDLHGDPVAIRGVVRMLDDGKFEDAGPTHGGFRFYDAGPRALVHTLDDHMVLLMSHPRGNTSRAELISAGLDPLEQPIIVAKGVHSPRAAYEPIAAEMIQLNTPGCTSADVSVLEYTYRPRPMFPYERDTRY